MSVYMILQGQAKDIVSGDLPQMYRVLTVTYMNNVTVWWLVLLFHIQDIIYSRPAILTEISLVSLILPIKYWASTSQQAKAAPSTSVPIRRS
jgi:hypothetical protein